MSHARVGWTTTALRHGPLDVLLRHLDRAAFAVKTVLSVDLKSLLLRLVVLHILVDFRRTESLLGPPVLLQRDFRRYLGHALLDHEMCWLVVVVIGSTSLQISEQIESEFAVGLRVLLGLVVLF